MTNHACTRPKLCEMFQTTDTQLIKSEPNDVISNDPLLPHTSDLCRSQSDVTPITADSEKSDVKLAHVASTDLSKERTLPPPRVVFNHDEKEMKACRGPSELEELVKNVSMSPVKAKSTLLLQNNSAAMIPLNSSHFLTDASILERINDLKTSGMLFAKRLPKLQEPPRHKTHWDYLLRLEKIHILPASFYFEWEVFDIANC